MPSPMDSIRLDVKKALYTSEDDIAFLAFSNRLVAKGTVTQEQYNQHYIEIAQLFEEWRTEVQAKDSEHNQQLPMSPPAPGSLPPQTEPYNTLPSSSPEDVRTVTAAETVKEAVAAIIRDGELVDAVTAWLYLPNDMNHATRPVAMAQSSCSQSYIREKTLDQNEIDWEGNTVVLRWKRMALIGNGDQSVQLTCFNVVDEAVASQAGFLCDMLIGVDHNVPLPNRTRAVRPDEANSTDSTVIEGADDLPAHSFEDSRSAELRPKPVACRSPQPASSTVSVSISGPGREVAIFFREIGAGGVGASEAMEGSTERLTGSHNVGCGKLKLSHNDDSGGRPFEEESFIWRIFAAVKPW